MAEKKDVKNTEKNKHNPKEVEPEKLSAEQGNEKAGANKPEKEKAAEKEQSSEQKQTDKGKGSKQEQKKTDVGKEQAEKQAVVEKAPLDSEGKTAAEKGEEQKQEQKQEQEKAEAGKEQKQEKAAAEKGERKNNKKAGKEKTAEKKQDEKKSKESASSREKSAEKEQKGSAPAGKADGKDDKKKEKKRREKKLMSSTVRIFLFLSVSAALITLLVLLAITLLVPQVKEEQITHYQYKQKGDLTYQVTLRDNPLYPEKVLGMGKVYPARYVDQILLKGAYEYSAEQPGQLSGEYQVSALIEGVTRANEQEKVLWSKNHVLIPKTAFQNDQGQIELKRDVVLPYWDYNLFVKQVQEETGINSTVRVTVFWHIKTKVETEHGIVEEELAPNLTLPLNVNYFEIAGELTQEDGGALSDTVRQTVPVDGNKGLFLGLKALLCLLFLIWLGTRTMSPQPDVYEKLVQQIFKKHGDRFVALETDLAANNDDMFGGAISELGATGMTGISRMAQNAGIVAGAKFNATEKMIRVKSVEDLVRVADEISQPVFYVESVLAENKGIAFYVFGDTTIFTYELKPVPQGVPLAQKKSGGITLGG